MNKFAAFVFILMPSAFAAPFRGFPDSVPVLLTPEVAAGQPTIEISYEIEEAQNQYSSSPWQQPTRFAPAYYETSLREGSSAVPFIFDGSRIGQEGFVSKLFHLLDLGTLEPSFYASKSTGIIFAREDQKDGNKPSGIAAWFKTLGDNIRKGWENLIHPKNKDNKDEPKKDDRPKPTATTSGASSSTAKPTETKDTSVAAPDPAADVKDNKDGQSTEPAPAQAAQGVENSVSAAQPTS